MTSPIDRWCAVALIVTPDGRYLMQHRDDKPGIFVPGHWGLFGGTVETGESPDEALRRELREELEFDPRIITPFTEMIIGLTMKKRRTDRLSFFVVTADHAEISKMVLHEGQGMALFAADQLACDPLVAPWDLAALLMHARQDRLFPS